MDVSKSEYLISTLLTSRSRTGLSGGILRATLQALSSTVRDECVPLQSVRELRYPSVTGSSSWKSSVFRHRAPDAALLAQISATAVSVPCLSLAEQPPILEYLYLSRRARRLMMPMAPLRGVEWTGKSKRVATRCRSVVEGRKV